jgi:thiamine biosynthesis protein ThiI
VRSARRIHDVARALQDVFGISSISPARSVRQDALEIAAVAREVLGEELEGRPRGEPIPFRVETQRSDKTFPMRSTELDRFVAERVIPEHQERLKVDLSRPELVLEIHVRPGECFVFAQRSRGAGGLPVGTLGRAVCLLSGGIDSPVAAWMTMKRGCSVVFVAFHSYPWIGASYQHKVERIVRALARFQEESVLYLVPFAPIQVEVRDRCPASYRTVLYRRMMQRVASRIARRERAGALVTGDSLGQVASQTLENLTCIEEASELPVLRPLIGFDKQETIERAQRIGTYELSIAPEPDCCTVFQPEKPVIRGRLEQCRAAEAALDVEGLVRAAAEGAERRVIAG